MQTLKYTIYFITLLVEWFWRGNIMLNWNYLRFWLAKNSYSLGRRTNGSRPFYQDLLALQKSKCLELRLIQVKRPITRNLLFKVKFATFFPGNGMQASCATSWQTFV